MRGMLPPDIGLLSRADQVRLTPDGTRVAWTVTGVDVGANRYRTRIWTADTLGGAPVPLGDGEGGDHLVSWAPDGRRLAYLRSRKGTPGTALRLVDVGGVGGDVELARFPDEVADVSWSPDGTRLAVLARCPDPAVYGSADRPVDDAARPPRRITHLFSRLNGEGFVADRPVHLLVVPADGSVAPDDRTPGGHAVGAAAWSPDSSTLAFSSARHDDWDLDLCNDVWLVAAGGDGEPRRVTDTAASWSLLSWAPDGTQLAAYRYHSPLAGPCHGALVALDPASGRWQDLMGGLDRNAEPYGKARPPARADGDWWFTVEDTGAVPLYRVAADGSSPPVLVVGDGRVVHDFDVAGGRLAWVASSHRSLPEVWLAAGTDPSTARPLTSLTRALTEQVEIVEPEYFVARSGDGTEVDCWAVAPVGVPVGQRCPTVLNIHGGPFSQYETTLFDEFQLQAGAGLGVVYCNPRGSSGRSEAWGRTIRWPEAEVDPGSGWGGVDHQDVMACVDEAVRRFAWVDPDRLGVQGGSYGGYMTSWIVAHSTRFVAACSERAANNLVTLEHGSDAAGSFRDYAGWSVVERPDIFARQSPSTYVTGMTTPMLLVHSENDLRCPMNQAEELFVALRLLGRSPELVRFPGEDHDLSRHGNPGHRIARAEIILEWFVRHLRPAPSVGQ